MRNVGASGGQTFASGAPWPPAKPWGAWLGTQIVHAPWSGVIRGLSHDRAIVQAGQKIVEVDPRSDANVFGIGERSSAIARGVSLALGFETGIVRWCPGPESNRHDREVEGF